MPKITTGSCLDDKRVKMVSFFLSELIVNRILIVSIVVNKISSS